MHQRMNTAEDWTPYLNLLKELQVRLELSRWFADDWKVQCRHVEAGNRVIFLLTKDRWCHGAIHFKTRLTNTDLTKGLVRVGLHVETSILTHGINRVVFDRFLLQQCGELIVTWKGYVVKPTHYQKPFHTWIPFTEETLVSGLEAEFARVQQLAPAIDQAIQSAKT